MWNRHLISNTKSAGFHYNDAIMGAMASQITSLTIINSTVYSDADQRKYQFSVSLAVVRGIHRWLVNSPHKEPVTRKMFPFDDVIMCWVLLQTTKMKYNGSCLRSSPSIMKQPLNSWWGDAMTHCFVLSPYKSWIIHVIMQHQNLKAQGAAGFRKITAPANGLSPVPCRPFT